MKQIITKLKMAVTENKRVSIIAAVVAVIVLIGVIVGVTGCGKGKGKEDGETKKSVSSISEDKDAKKEAEKETKKEEETTYPEEVETDKNGAVVSVKTENGETIDIKDAEKETDAEGNTIYTSKSNEKVIVKKDGSVEIETQEETTENAATEEITEAPTTVQTVENNNVNNVTEAPTPVQTEAVTQAPAPAEIQTPAPTEAPTEKPTEAPTTPAVKPDCPYKEGEIHVLTLEDCNAILTKEEGYPSSFSSLDDAMKWMSKLHPDPDGDEYLYNYIDISKPVYWYVKDTERYGALSMSDKILYEENLLTSVNGENYKDNLPNPCGGIGFTLYQYSREQNFCLLFAS